MRTVARCMGMRKILATSLMVCGLGAGFSANATLVTIPQSALNPSPGVYTAGGYYTNALGPNIVTTGGGNAANVGQLDGRNDDGFMSLSLGFNFTFFGNTYNSLFINNNGNVTFNSGLSSYIPTGPTGASVPIISPFFSDVDTRNGSSGVVHYDLTADQLVVTWDNVGRFNALGVPPSDSYQLVLRSDSFVVPVGEGQIGFFYEGMGWDVAQTSTTAAVGFGDGLGNGEVIAGSNSAGMAAVMNDTYLWFDPNLNPIGVPEPTTLALVAAALLGAGTASRKRRNV